MAEQSGTDLLAKAKKAFDENVVRPARKLYDNVLESVNEIPERTRMLGIGAVVGGAAVAGIAFGADRLRRGY